MNNAVLSFGDLGTACARPVTVELLQPPSGNASWFSLIFFAVF